MESLPFQARFFFSLYSVNTYGPFSVENKTIGWIRIFPHLLTSQIGFLASRDFIWICHFKECEVGLHWDRRFDLHTRKEAGWLYVLATFKATIKTYKIFSSVEFAKVSYSRACFCICICRRSRPDHSTYPSEGQHMMLALTDMGGVIWTFNVKGLNNNMAG